MKRSFESGICKKSLVLKRHYLEEKAKERMDSGVQLANPVGQGSGKLASDQMLFIN